MRQLKPTKTYLRSPLSLALKAERSCLGLPHPESSTYAQKHRELHQVSLFQLESACRFHTDLLSEWGLKQGVTQQIRPD